MRRYLLALLILSSSVSVFGEERFPRPEFESGYRQPPLTFQIRPTFTGEVIEAILLLVALGLAVWFLLRKRSRQLVFVLCFFSLLFFGFYKHGCICPIGSIQNVVLSFCDPDYAIPLVVVVAFAFPLIFAFMWGRVFCGSVCALGAIQDVFLFHPVKVPRWLEEGLGLLRYLILGTAVYFVVEYSLFVICQYDPFVSFFRFSGPAWKYALGAGLLLIAMFFGRPYCRFFCPYGALLSMLARWTTSGVNPAPDRCVECTLCEDSCPFGAIEGPTPAYRVRGYWKLLAWYCSALMTVGLGVVGYLASNYPGLGLGIWFGLVFSSKLLQLAYPVERTTVEVNHARCFSCGRCYESCPRSRASKRNERASE